MEHGKKEKRATVSAAILLIFYFYVPSNNGRDAKNEAEDYEKRSEQQNAVGPHLRNMVQQE
ncbi:hypothetical protein [Paenibacillus ihbetae]|uniref:Uncharacterized protein n=1 Tax=Paenibacillus ihbetae TaxID=1870820 RepID=A0ABX3JUH1_9BACL|nr:hypothetical protein [Paenibacillus ihbetae]OOC59362.1 hypothetical protein BBD40_27475 [Paenibacillus ihbetae]